MLFFLIVNSREVTSIHMPINQFFFSNFINSNHLFYLGFVGSAYTWCNDQSGLAHHWAHLDPFLANHEWITSYSSYTNRHLLRSCSDHAHFFSLLLPLLIIKTIPFGLITLGLKMKVVKLVFCVLGIPPPLLLLYMLSLMLYLVSKITIFNGEVQGLSPLTRS